MPGTVVTLLHCDGTNGSTTLTDTGIGARTWTAHNGAALSTAVHQFGTASIALDGVDDYFETPASADFAFGTGDFTIEFWGKKSADGANGFDTALTTDTTDGSAINGWIVELSSSRGFVFAYNAAVVISATPTINDSTLHAWAMDRAGTTVRLYKDGAVLATATNSDNILADGPLGIGRNANLSSFAFAGNIDEARITLGAALYAGAYTPAASAFSDPAAGSQSGTATGIAPTAAFGTPFAVFRQTGQATGFSSTALGTPFAVYQHIESATGFSSTVFGIPSIPLVPLGIAATTAFGTPANVPNAIGFRSTAFGIPSIPLVATGFSGTAFGTPLGFQHWRAIALGPTALFGTPTTPTNRSQDASGFSSTVIGDPVAIRFMPPLATQIELTSGASTTAFGLATAAASIIGDATGINSTAFGAPASAISDRVTASPVDPQTALGTPTLLVGARASGMRSTSFGTPSVDLVQPAASTYRAARFGLPTCVRSNTYLTRGIGPTSRMGHPRALNRFNHPATAIAPTTAIGTPSAQQGHRVTATAPGAQFGTPLLQRNPQC